MLASLASNYMVDYLTPVVFDGRAHVVDLPSGDPRLKLEQILAWEFNNLLDLFERASQQMLLRKKVFAASQELARQRAIGDPEPRHALPPAGSAGGVYGVDTAGLHGLRFSLTVFI